MEAEAACCQRRRASFDSFSRTAMQKALGSHFPRFDLVCLCADGENKKRTPTYLPKTIYLYIIQAKMVRLITVRIHTKKGATVISQLQLASDNDDGHLPIVNGNYTKRWLGLSWYGWRDAGGVPCLGGVTGDGSSRILAAMSSWSVNLGS